MIQRKQTVHLFMGAVALFVVAFQRHHLTLESMPWIGNVIGVVALLTGAAAFLTISMYKDREKQLKWARIVLLVSIFIAGDIVATVWMMGYLPTIGEHQPLLIATALSVSSMILFFLAQRGVKKDIKRVQSMDRLR